MTWGQVLNYKFFHCMEVRKRAGLLQFPQGHQWKSPHEMTPDKCYLVKKK
jgi:hypothetical protein